MEEKNESQAHEFWQENGGPEQKPIIFKVLCIRVGVGGVWACLVRDGAGLCMLRGGEMVETGWRGQKSEVCRRARSPGS